MMRRVSLAVMFVMAASSLASAQERRTISELLADGYEIKGTSAERSGIVITLQKGKLAYLCTIHSQDQQISHMSQIPCEALSKSTEMAIMSGRQGSAPDNQVPQGSYLQSCTGIRSSGSIVTANECRTRSGNFHPFQTFDTNGCLDDIRNIDGNITCSKGTEEPPQGSFLETCVSVVSQDNLLYAKCKPVHASDDTAEWTETSLANYKSCKGDISNQDGRLQC